MDAHSKSLRVLARASERVRYANELHEKALRNILAEIDWMDDRVYKCRQQTYPGGRLGVGDSAHILERWHENDGTVKAEAHPAKGCVSVWCVDQNVQQFVRYRRRGQRTGVTFRGNATVLAVVDGHIILSPDVTEAPEAKRQQMRKKEVSA